MKGLLPRVFETRAIDRYANPPKVSCAPEWGRTTKPLDPQSNALSIELRVQVRYVYFSVLQAYLQTYEARSRGKFFANHSADFSINVCRTISL